MIGELMHFLSTYAHGYTPAAEGFVFLWFTLISGIVGVVLVVERWNYLIKRASINSQRFMLEVTKMISTNKIDKAIELCDAEPEAALPRICKRGLQHAGTDARTIQTAVDEATLEVLPLLGKRVGFIGMIGQTATLLGLLGTVYGLIKSFNALGDPNLDPALKGSMLAGGIAAALLCTMTGLMVAVPMIVANSTFREKITEITDDIDEYSVKLINMLAARTK
ncbi:MAG: MotA/TolQ/ExbB proton channel family protein [candidate division Zixibacteria bacterium]|nr:MotA/TolQ/ExbB proton channel family protein [candidate division Zixibacteria bacterium]